MARLAEAAEPSIAKADEVFMRQAVARVNLREQHVEDRRRHTDGRTGDAEDRHIAEIRHERHIARLRRDAVRDDLRAELPDGARDAGGGDGAEVYHSIVGGKGKRLADNILSEFEKIGQNVRGAKTKPENGTDYFGFIRLTDMPAVITEAVFVDNAADAAQADTEAECKTFGIAIAKGVLRTLGIADNVVTSNTPSKPAQTIYRVQVGAYTNRYNAIKLAKKLNSIGYKTLIVKGGK